MSHPRHALVLASLLSALGCAGPEAPREEPDTPAPPDAGTVPEKSCSGPPGLYVEGSCTELATGVRAYAPHFQLWSDGAEKTRYVFLPPGKQIDTTTPGTWSFPVGTKLWKEFGRDGKRLETRFLEKTTEGTGADKWKFRVFAWNAEQDAVTQLSAAQPGALGTTHDIPSPADCVQCHKAAPGDAPLGFTAIQLAHDGEGVTLAQLNAESLISKPISNEDAAIPGDAKAQAALGWLNANCASCHGGAFPMLGLDLSLAPGLTSIAETGAGRTAIAKEGFFTIPEGTSRVRIVPGDPDASTVFFRLSHRGAGLQMPPQPWSKELDVTAVTNVREWIQSLE